MSTSTHARILALQRAADLLGSDKALAVQLGVSEGRLRLWLSGNAVIPPEVFLQAIDIIADDDPVVHMPPTPERRAHRTTP